VIEWVSAVREQAAAEARRIHGQLAAWDASLHDLGGDPARDDWTEFRPLRLSREEDWSDWLAYLIRAPEGHAVARLFSPAQSSEKVEKARREVTVADGERRADLILEWSGSRAAHVEVKIWDQNFDKTLQTGKGCRGLYTHLGEWRDYVLLPEESLQAWFECEDSDKVSVVTWSDVDRELRRCLLAPGGSSQWAAFARAFCGAVEQKILGVPRFESDGRRAIKGASVFRFGRIVMGAIEDEQGS
jgi:hypothetical protein